MTSRLLYAYLAALVCFLVLDGLWLGIVARKFYVQQLGALMRDAPLWSVAAAFYLLYVVAIVVLAVMPADQAGGLMRAALLGGVLGLAAYGTYDATNLATLKNWPWQVSIVDCLWGMVVTAASACAGLAGARWAG